MKYIEVFWKSEDIGDPYRLVSELDDLRYETRKLEFFHSGAVGFASKYHESTDTRLSIEPIPELEDINTDAQFSGQELSLVEFEILWGQHGRELDGYEVVEIIATPGDTPPELKGTKVAILLKLVAGRTIVYEVEAVAADGSTVWGGALPRERLKGALPSDV